jgi:hypothetical protein
MTVMSDDEDFNSGNRRSQILPGGSGAHSSFVWLVLVTFPRRGRVAGTCLITHLHSVHKLKNS